MAEVEGSRETNSAIEAIEACNALPSEDVHILYFSPKISVRGTTSPVEKRERSSSSG
jgi:hypothetical protein